ncbi:MAG: hypothetical protein EAZ09_11110 [Oscillatoriales cyanobacterium]|nr:MAG: hypothetical protein EAZ18_09760 [Oscillatoriales cyanobacterium]TAH22124.1 MAG: hypothetical protein EAZ09_11110 [Oscillatoriales cyanobacterium]
MNTIAIALSDERLLKLQKVANDLNVSIEELVLIGIENLLAQEEVYSQNTTQNILKINAGISPEIVDKFYALASDWEKEVAGLSSTAQMSQHPAYQEIINMGVKIVPLLLSELQKSPLYWLSALSAITGENPIKPEQRGRVKQMALAWIEWGRNQGYAIEENV